MTAAFVTINLALLSLTLIPRIRSEYWLVRVLDYPRLQLFTCATIVLVFELVLLDLGSVSAWALITATLFCMVYQGWWIFPYTPFARVEVKKVGSDEGGDSIKLMVANVLGNNRNADLLLKQVDENQPDLLVTLESDSWWESQLDRLQSRYPHSVKCPQENLYGMHLYSRLPLAEKKVSCLLNQNIPSIHTLIKLPGGKQVRAHFLHPDPPNPKYSDDTSERDAELIIVGRSVAESDEPALVAGDLNDVAWSPTTRLFRKISHLRDPRVGRGMFNTFNANHWFLRWPLDHLFISDHFAIRSIRRLGHIHSDHFPLFTEIVFNGKGGNPDTNPEPDEDDRARAQAKMADEGVSPEDVP